MDEISSRQPGEYVIGEKDGNILRVAKVDIIITERSPTGQVPANPNGYDLSQLVDQIIQLGVHDVWVEISDIKRRHDELISSSTTTVGIGNRILRQNLNPSHLNQNNSYNNNLDFSFFPKKIPNFSLFFFFFLFVSLPPPLVIGYNKNTLGRTEYLTQGTIMITRSSKKFLIFLEKSKEREARWMRGG